MSAPIHGPDGRWGGRLASRALPDVDDTVDALDAPMREDCVGHWLGRAMAERRASDAFVVISADLQQLKADPALIELSRRAIDDELRHAELCRLVAARYAGRDVRPPRELPLEVPAHAAAPAALRPMLHVIGQCAVNETTATAFLEACLARAEGPLVRAALRELLSDDIDHARIGWATLAASPAPLKRAIAPWIVPILQGNLRTWRKPGPPRRSDAMSGHGALAEDEIDAAVIEAMRALIVPGLAQVGLDAAPAERWLAAGCPA